MNFLNLLDKLIEVFEDIISIILFWVVALLIGIKVINRYLLHFEIMEIGDLSLYLFIIVSLASIALTTRRDEHTSFSMIQDKLISKNLKIKRLFKKVENIIAFIIITFFLYTSFGFFSMALKYPQYGTLVKWFNTSWLRISYFALVVLLFYHLFYRLIVDFRKERKVKD